MSDSPAAADQRVRRRARILSSALSGFVDVTLCCLLLVGLGAALSLAWGVVGAMGFTLVLLALIVAQECWDLGGEGCEGPDLIAMLDEFNEYLDELPEDDPDPWPVRWLWNALTVVGWLVFTLVVWVVGTIRTVLTVVVFAIVVGDAPLWRILVVLGAAFLLTAALIKLIVEPYAERHGVDLNA